MQLFEVDGARGLGSLAVLLLPAATYATQFSLPDCIRLAVAGARSLGARVRHAGLQQLQGGGGGGLPQRRRLHPGARLRAALLHIPLE